jgi:hypothetical protein
MAKTADAQHALMQFIHDVGIPKNCLMDRAPEERLAGWGEVVKHHRIKLRTTEAYRPWQNRAESGIREIKKLCNRVMRHTSTPMEFWCYANN